LNYLTQGAYRTMYKYSFHNLIKHQIQSFKIFCFIG